MSCVIARYCLSCPCCWSGSISLNCRKLTCSISATYPSYSTALSHKPQWQIARSLQSNVAQIPGLAWTQHKLCLSYNGPSEQQLAKVVLLCNFTELKMPLISPSTYPGPMLLSQMVCCVTQWLQLLARPLLWVVVMTCAPPG